MAAASPEPFFSAQRKANWDTLLKQPEIAAKIAEVNATQRAEGERMKAVAAFQHQQAMDTIKEFQKQGISHYFVEFGPTGSPLLKPDRGAMIPGIVSGAELAGETDPKTGAEFDPNKFYRIKEFTSDNSREYFPQLNVKEIKSITTPDGKSYQYF